MKMYTKYDVQTIVELFLASHFNFENVTLNPDSIKKLEEICEPYEIEVGNVQRNN